MTTTTVLKAESPRDILSYVDFTLGYRPRDSLVMACLGRDRGRIGLVARNDLPAHGATAPVARLLADLAGRNGAGRVVLVVYCDEPVPAALVATLSAAFRCTDVDLLDVFHVDADRYRCLTCSAPCCPAEGWPLEELRSSLVGAEMVLRGEALVADRAALVGDLTPLEGDLRREVARVARRAEARWRSGTPDPWRQRTAALQLWERALEEGSEAISVETIGHLLAALQDLRVRDAVMLATCPGGRQAARALAAGAGEAELGPALDAVFGSARRGAPVPPPPDPDLVRAVDALLRQLVRSCRGARRSAPMGVLAWLAWWRGDGALADQLVDRLLQVDPHSSLGVLLRTAVDRCIPPPWTGLARD